MRKTIIFAAFAALVSLASCQKEEAIYNNGTDKSASPVFTASISGATRTTIDMTDGKVEWEATDEITVTDATSASAIYEIESIDATTGKATFVYKSGATLGDGPYTATYGTEPATAQTYSATAGKLYMTAPETSGNSFAFTVQCGLMKLNLTKTGESVKSIAVTGTPIGGSETTYTLTCTEAQSIATAKDFCLALPAGSYTKIIITNESYATATLNSEPGVAIAANHIKPVTIKETKINFVPLPEGALPGQFSVSETKQVNFSRGNLQAVYDGGEYCWKFASKQYEVIGDSDGNKTIDSQEEDTVVDLFGWSTESTYYGISTLICLDFSKDCKYCGDFKDWGENIGDGNTWRTLSYAEWDYLAHSRPNASNLFKFGVSVCNKNECIVIAPDNFPGTIESSYNTESWSIAEAAGLVCLPAAGIREGSNVFYVGEHANYWTSTPLDSFYAYYIYYYYNSYSDARGSRYDGLRHYGCSVRLVTDVTE